MLEAYWKASLAVNAHGVENKTEDELLEMFRSIVSAPGPISDTQMDDIITIAREFDRRAKAKARNQNLKRFPHNSQGDPQK